MNDNNIHLLHKTIDDLQSKLAEKESLYNNQNEEINVMQNELSHSKNRIRELELSIQSKQHTENDLHVMKQKEIQLQNQLHSFKAENRSLTEELTYIQDSLDKHIIQVQEMNEENVKLNQENVELKTNFEKVKNKLIKSESSVESLSNELNTLKMKLEESEIQVKRMRDQSNRFEAMERERDEAIVKTKNVEKRSEEWMNAALERHYIVQNELQATRQTLEQLKLEYELFSESVPLKHRHQTKQLMTDYSRLKEDFENFKLKELSDKQNLIRQQGEVIQALQNQFQEYRNAAETLFESEAVRVQEQLEIQANKYEQEILYIQKVKDRKYSQMLTAKDAKIMSLIEGTDMQRMMIKHENELDQMNKQHQRDLEMACEIVKSDQRKLVNELNEMIRQQQQKIEKMKLNTAGWERKLNEMSQLVENEKSRYIDRETRFQDTLKEKENELTIAYKQIEQMNQTKEHLKHQILRMRLQLEGRADESLASMIQRLDYEAKELSTHMSGINETYKEKLSENERLQNKVNALEVKNSKLEKRNIELIESKAQLSRQFEQLWSKLHSNRSDNIDEITISRNIPTPPTTNYHLEQRNRSPLEYRLTKKSKKLKQHEVIRIQVPSRSKLIKDTINQSKKLVEKFKNTNPLLTS